MKKIYILTFFILCFSMQQSFAQRYVEEVFTDDQITVISDVEYSINMSVFLQIFSPAVNLPLPDTLKADIWMPDMTIDTETERPVIFLNATGLLRPYIIDCFGNKTDMTRTYIANEMAKRGFVVVVVDTREGINLFAPTNDSFLKSIADWALRQNVDMRTAAAFIKKDITESGNTYGANIDEFIQWAPALGNSSKTSYTTMESEFQSANYFVLDTNNVLVNVVDLELNGGIFGAVQGMDGNGNISNIPNHVDYIEDYPFDLVVSANGSITDTFTIQANEPPSITYLSLGSNSARAEVRATFLPATQQFCCNTFSGQVFQRQHDQVGNVDIWKGVEFTDPVANTRSVYPADPSVGEIEGLLTVNGPEGNGSPWIFWDEATCEAIGAATNNPDLNMRNILGQPGMTPAVGMGIIDTVIRYWTPRACVLFGWDCAETVVSSNEDVFVAANRINISPNPSAGNFTFSTSEALPIESIRVFNTSGALMYETQVDNYQITIDDMGLSTGMYIAKIKFEDGVATKKITVER